MDDDEMGCWDQVYTVEDIDDLITTYSNRPKSKSKAIIKDLIDDDDIPDSRNAKMFESFAKEAMDALVEANIASFVLLKNDKLRAWWQGVVKKELAEQTKREAAERKKQLKEQALSKLSDEEKEALGLNRKK